MYIVLTVKHAFSQTGKYKNMSFQTLGFKALCGVGLKMWAAFEKRAVEKKKSTFSIISLFSVFFLQVET